ncbi:hypothetical protein ACFWBF_22685 [Streptomyces sp. NPDC060028]|uniref:hypothetical protein n=1 Tax=Streptomyces sp. NPDC060028 TaxID=3347041 RepID=UPI0036BA4F93
MSALDFYAHVATRCDVLGAGVGTDPDGWEAAAGAGFLDVPGGGFLRRDYGLVEINFSPDEHGLMSCFGFGVKIQRLLYDQSPGTVPSPLSRQYGSFAPRVPFEDLRVAVLALGHTLQLDDESRDMRRYRVPESGAHIHVIVDPDPYGSGDPDPDGHQVGDVWSIEV